jgi:hypothetical protein
LETFGARRSNHVPLKLHLAGAANGRNTDNVDRPAAVVYTRVNCARSRLRVKGRSPEQPQHRWKENPSDGSNHENPPEFDMDVQARKVGKLLFRPLETYFFLIRRVVQEYRKAGSATPELKLSTFSYILKKTLLRIA